MQKQSVKPNIKHVLSDGTKIDCIDGVKIPINTTTQPTYKLLANYARKTMYNHINSEQTA